MKSKNELRRDGVGWMAIALYYVGALRYRRYNDFRVRLLHPIGFLSIILLIIISIIVCIFTECFKFIWKTIVDFWGETCLW